MGTLFRIAAYAADDPARVFRAAFNRVAELDAKLSDYKPDSELNRLCRTGRAEVSRDLLTVLTVAQDLARETDGAFDVTEGPVIRLWREARRTRRLPTPAALMEAADRTGYRNLAIHGNTATLLVRGMQLDLGGIAKGYAADEAMRVLNRGGLTQSLVAASGDLVIGEAPPGEAGWKVGMGQAQIGETFILGNCAVSTSGDTEQFAEIDGARYSHIIDPHTHRPLTDRIGVTVIAATGTEADGLATALSVLGVERGERLLVGKRGVTARFT